MGYNSGFKGLTEDGKYQGILKPSKWNKMWKSTTSVKERHHAML